MATTYQLQLHYSYFHHNNIESHVKQLKQSNEPVPKIVQVLLDDERQREEKLMAKKLSNRKSALKSIERKKEVSFNKKNRMFEI